MKLQFDKKKDGVTVLTCTRRDGSVTWQRHDRHGVFFALHDLTHYAIESVLRLKGGFYGIVASGWDITDFGEPWPRGRIPSEYQLEADLAEGLAGVLGLEQSSRSPFSLAEVLSALDSQEDVKLYARDLLSEPVLQTIRETYSKLAIEWMNLQPGESLTIDFPD